MDEVEAAKRKRWVRQLAEAMAEAFRAEMPPSELAEAAADFQLAFGLRVSPLPPRGFDFHEASPTVDDSPSAGRCGATRIITSRLDVRCIRWGGHPGDCAFPDSPVVEGET